MFTQAETTPPPPNNFNSITTSPGPTPSIPHDTRKSPPLQPTAAGGSHDTCSPKATNTAHAPSPYLQNKPDPPTHTALWCGRCRCGAHRIWTWKFLPLPNYFFHASPKIPDDLYTLPTPAVFSYNFLSPMYFLHVPYSLHFRIPIPCIIIIHSLYPVSVRSGIRYLYNLVASYCIYARCVSRLDPPAWDNSQAWISCV